MRILVVHGTDPNDANTWSGIPKHIIHTLRTSGHVVETIGPLPRVETRWRRLKSWCHQALLGKEYLAIRDPSALRARASALNRIVAGMGSWDCVLVLHAADAAILKTSATVVYIHDATWHQLLDFYPRYQRRRLAPATISGGYALDRRALDNCDRAIFSSHWAADSARRVYGIGADKLCVHPFGPNLASIADRHAVDKAIARRGQGACRLLFVGADFIRKGGDRAIAIAQELRHRGLPVELQIVGSDPPVGAPDFVHGLGFLARDDHGHAAKLAYLYLDADFLLLPARADCSPIALSEAAASGLPVATSAVGAIGEIIGDDCWGVALPPDATVGAYVDWIHAAMANRGGYVRMALNARRTFERRLNWSAFSRKLIGVIADARALSSRSVPPQRALSGGALARKSHERQ